MDRIVSIAPLRDRVLARRRPILVLVLTSTIVVGVIAFLLHPWYRAEAEILPPTEEETVSGLASLMRGAGVPGLKIPTQVTPGDVFMAVLQSRRINTMIAERFDLKKLYKKKFMVDALKELSAHTSFKLTLAGTIQ